MKLAGVRSQTFVNKIVCDKCGVTAQAEDAEFHEFVSVDTTAGYGSIFGDGNRVQLDLCQSCVKEALGRWLRVTEPGEVLWERTLAEVMETSPVSGDELSPQLADALPGSDQSPVECDPAKHVCEFPDPDGSRVKNALAARPIFGLIEKTRDGYQGRIIGFEHILLTGESATEVEHRLGDHVARMIANDTLSLETEFVSVVQLSVRRPRT